MDGGLQTSSEHTHILQQGITKNQMCTQRTHLRKKKESDMQIYHAPSVIESPPVKILPRYVWFGRDPEVERC